MIIQFGCTAAGQAACDGLPILWCAHITGVGAVIAGDRLLTPWLKLLGGGAPDPPMVHITLKRTGDVLKKAKAEVRPRAYVARRKLPHLILETGCSEEDMWLQDHGQIMLKTRFVPPAETQ